MSKHLGTLTLDLVANIGRYLEPLNRAERKTQQTAQHVSQQFKEITHATTEMQSSLQRLEFAFGGVMGYMSAQQLVSYADGYVQLNNKLKLVTQSEQQLQTALNDTFKIAQETASTWSSVNEIYTKFAQNQEKLKLTQQEVADITKTVAKAVSMSGASALAADAALMQFGQALNTGVLRGDELRSVMEQTPALAKAIADGLGVAVGDLKRLGEEGKITTEYMVAALQKVAPQVEKEYAKTATTISESFNRVNNEITKLIGKLDQTYGVSNKAVSGITLLSENMDKLAALLGLGAAAMMSRYTGAIVASMVAGYQQIQQLREKYVQQRINIEQEIRESQSKIANAQATLVALNAEKALEVERLKAQINQAGRIATATRMAELKRIETQVTAELAVANNALAVAQGKVVTTTTLLGNAGRSLVGMLGGSVGLGITLATIAGGYLMMKKSTDDATQSLNLQHKTVAQLTEEFKKLTDSQKRQVIQQQTEQLTKHTQELKEHQSALMGVVREIQRKNEVTGQDGVILDTALRNYRQGKIDIETFGSIVSSLSYKSEEWKNKLNDQVVATSKATEQVKFSNDVLNTYKDKAREASNSSNAFAKSTHDVANKAKTAQGQILGLANAYAHLSQKQQEALGKIQTDVDYSKYVQGLVAEGFPLEKAKIYADYRQESIGFSNSVYLRDEEKILLDKKYQATLANQKLEEQKKAQEEKKRQKTKEQKKKYEPPKIPDDVKKSILWGANELGINPNYLASVISFETGKTFSTNARHPKTSATGLIQFMEDADGKYDGKYYGMTRNQFGALPPMEQMEYVVKFLRMKGVKPNASLGKIYDAVTGTGYRDIPKYNKKGERVDPYHLNRVWDANKDGYIAPGESVTSGAFKQHMHNWFPNGVDNVELGEAQADIAKIHERTEKEALQKQEEINQKREQLIYDMMSPIQQIQERMRKQLEEMGTLGLDYQTQFKPYLEQIERNAQMEINLLEYTNKTKLNHLSDFLKTEKQLLKEKYEDDVFRTQNNKELTNDEIQYALSLIKYRYDYELQKIEDVEKERIKQVGNMILDMNDIMPNLIDLKAQRNMSPIEYQRWKTQNQFEADTLNAYGTFNQVKDEINKKNENGFYEIADEQKRYQLIQEAERQHQQTLLNIREQYRILGKDLDRQEYESKMQMYQSMLGQAGQVWGTMTEMVKNSAGENSRAYKAMFLVQQSIAIGQAIINTELAATRAIAEGGPYAGPALAAATRAMGYISVGLIASQTLSGMAHSGIDNIPQEGTWLLDKGERVLSPRQNADLTKFLRNQNQTSSQPITINIVVNSSDSTVSGDGTQDQKLLGESIANAVRAVIIKEQRQGGLLNRS